MYNCYILFLGKKIDSWYFIDWNTGEKHPFMNFDKQGEICTAIASKSILLSKSGKLFLVTKYIYVLFILIFSLIIRV